MRSLTLLIRHIVDLAIFGSARQEVLIHLRNKLLSEGVHGNIAGRDDPGGCNACAFHTLHYAVLVSGMLRTNREVAYVNLCLLHANDLNLSPLRSDASESDFAHLMITF